ncbi:uncharacterized protein (DUF736 family) [Sphingomonas zeicaulis]|uniref:DUF736 domain-containing protein n=1 Tax=Sphingomonas zeicaulis TaxID=1632740 RepID=UPI003D245F70
MNIGSLKQNASGTFTGRISTMKAAITIALRAVSSPNERAPKYEIFGLSSAKSWVQIGALFELESNRTGDAFLNGKIDDPSFAAPLHISAFRQEDGSYNIVWSRPDRRRSADAALERRTADTIPPLPGEEGNDATPTGESAGLGNSTAQPAFAGGSDTLDDDLPF